MKKILNNNVIITIDTQLETFLNILESSIEEETEITNVIFNKKSNLFQGKISDSSFRLKKTILTFCIFTTTVFEGTISKHKNNQCKLEYNSYADSFILLSIFSSIFMFIMTVISISPMKNNFGYIILALICFSFTIIIYYVSKNQFKKTNKEFIDLINRIIKNTNSDLR